MVQKLNLPEYSFRIKKENGKDFIFDDLRKKFVRLTPEEWVRQNFIQFLIQDKDYPRALIAVESGVSINQNQLRADLIIFRRNGIPVMVIEFKSPSIKITQQAFDQIVRYNMQLKVQFLTVSNGIEHFCCQINYQESNYTFLSEIPNYSDIK